MIENYMDRTIHRAITQTFGITPREIDDGSCFNWAFIAKKVLGRKATLYSACENHAFVRYNGKFYDAECPRGVKYWWDLPVVREYPHYYADDYAERQSIADFTTLWQDIGKHAMIVEKLEKESRALKRNLAKKNSNSKRK